MPRSVERFDVATVRRGWDAAADTYMEGQARGRDRYRFHLFGPAQVALCGDVTGLDLLDLGCGNGYFSREMARLGANVTGIDVSPRMIEHARRLESEAPLGIDYLEGDAAEASTLVQGRSFDMVTSCMALMDMPGPDAVIGAIPSLLRPGGRLVVSITHPCCNDTPVRAWEKDEAGRKLWLRIDRYFDRGPLAYDWTGWAEPFTTVGLHATLADWMGWFLGAGFALRSLEEPCPTPEVLARFPDLEDAARVPYYLLLDFELSRDR